MASRTLQYSLRSKDLRGRLKQPPYSNPGYFLRVREQSKEVGPPMRYAAKNEMERVHDSLSNLTVNDSGEWDEGELFPVWRHVAPSKWKGGRKRLHTAPATGLSHSVTGEPHFAPIHSSEPYVIHRQSSHAVKDSQEGFRPRQKEGELAGEFGNVVRRDEYTRSTSAVSFNYEPWQRSVPRMPYHTSVRSLSSPAS